MTILTAEATSTQSCLPIEPIYVNRLGKKINEFLENIMVSNDKKEDIPMSTIFISDYQKKIENTKKIESFLKYDNGWNSYSATKFDIDIILRAINLLPLFEKQPKVFPTGRSTVQFEFSLSRNRYYEIEIFKNNYQIYYEDDSGFEKEYIIETESDLMKDFESFYVR